MAVWIIRLLAVWGMLVTALVGVLVFFSNEPPEGGLGMNSTYVPTGPDDPYLITISRAVLSMGLGLTLIWCVGFGIISWRLRQPLVDRLVDLPGSPLLKFIMACTVLALLEEAVTVSMTNLAPLFGVKIGEAFITASANYFDVVLLHSVVVFVPMFFCWGLVLSRYRFSPPVVFLLFGLTGWLAEALFAGDPNPATLAFWTFVYGLMVYLPAHVFRNEHRPPPRWWHYPLAVFLPFLFTIPVAILIQGLHPVKIHF